MSRRFLILAAIPYPRYSMNVKEDIADAHWALPQLGAGYCEDWSGINECRTWSKLSRCTPLWGLTAVRYLPTSGSRGSFCVALAYLSDTGIQFSQGGWRMERAEQMSVNL